ncbi:MAG: formimidoylglutamate deiminase [Bacteroidetes bacterium]|nr:formimidoylglutamate deiminase [Bacteroidota bacterium]
MPATPSPYPAEALVSPLRTLSAEWVLLPDGWHQRMEIRFDTDGVIHDVAPATGSPDEDLLVPGMINGHSHVFQLDLIGRNQRFQHPGDDFWSWRTGMYALASTLTPTTQEDVAYRAFRAMLAHGYTTVCEFHYTHGATRRDNGEMPVLMSEAVLRAAERAGIRIRLLPVLYQQGGFGERPLTREQRSFGLDTQVYLGLMDHLRHEVPLSSLQTLGYAPHSLRAVGLDALRDLVDHRNETAADAPIHMHISEQVREVNEAVLGLGRRPVEWLIDTFDLDASWCLVHATHMSPAERSALAASGAVVCLCPTTEADLGDGYFSLLDWLAHRGTWAIGTDSNGSVNPAEEIRLLDWHQRLHTRRRNAFQFDSSLGAGTRLFQQALAGGRQAASLPVGRIEPGAFADVIALHRTPRHADMAADDILNAWLYSANPSWIRQVYTEGQPRLTPTP